MVLKPLPEAGTVVNPSEPLRTCEACGHQEKSSLMINCIMVIGSPGHPDLPPFQCGHEEHWACSRECWLIVAHACIDEHMHELLKAAHQTVGL